MKVRQRKDSFEQHVLRREHEILGDDASPELTHAFRMGVQVAAKYFVDMMAKKIKEKQGPIN